MKKENILKFLLVIVVVAILILIGILLQNNSKIEKQELAKKQLETTNDNEYITVKEHFLGVSNTNKNNIEAILFGGTGNTSFVEISNIGFNYVNSNDFSYSGGVFTALKDINLRINFVVGGFRTSWGEAQCGYGQIIHNGTTIANLTQDGQEFTTSGSYVKTISLSKGDTLTVRVRAENSNYTMKSAFVAYSI